jgi:hypothetical protein
MPGPRAHGTPFTSHKPSSGDLPSSVSTSFLLSHLHMHRLAFHSCHFIVAITSKSAVYRNLSFFLVPNPSYLEPNQHAKMRPLCCPYIPF